MNRRSLFSLSLLSTAFLTACGGGSSSVAPSPVVNSTLSGTVQKGSLQNAVVQVYALTPAGKGSLLGATRTDANGDYSLALPSGFADKVLVEASADSGTTMVCDASEGCLDSKGAKIPAGSALAAPATLKLASAVPASAVRAGKAMVTPLTEMVWQQLAQNKTNISDDSIKALSQKLADMTGLTGVDITQAKPAAFDRAVAEGTPENERYALINSGFAALATSNNKPVEQIINEYVQAFVARNGQLPNAEGTGNLASLFDTAAKNAQFVPAFNDQVSFYKANAEQRRVDAANGIPDSDGKRLPNTAATALERAKSLVKQVHDFIVEGKNLADDWNSANPSMEEIKLLKKQQMFYSAQNQAELTAASSALKVVGCVLGQQIKTGARQSVHIKLENLANCNEYKGWKYESSYDGSRYTYRYIPIYSITQADLNIGYQDNAYTINGMLTTPQGPVSIGSIRATLPAGASSTPQLVLNEMIVNAGSFLLSTTPGLASTASVTFIDPVDLSGPVDHSNIPLPKTASVELKGITLKDMAASVQGDVLDTFVGNLKLEAVNASQPVAGTDQTVRQAVPTSLTFSGTMKRDNSPSNVDIALSFNIDPVGLAVNGLPAVYKDNLPLVVADGPQYYLSADQKELKIFARKGDPVPYLHWKIAPATLISSSTNNPYLYPTYRCEGDIADRYWWGSGTPVCYTYDGTGVSYGYTTLNYSGMLLDWQLNSVIPYVANAVVNGKAVVLRGVGLPAKPVYNQLADLPVYLDKGIVSSKSYASWPVAVNLSAIVKTRFAGVERQFAVDANHAANTTNTLALTVAKPDGKLVLRVSAPYGTPADQMDFSVANQSGASLVFKPTAGTDFNRGTITVDGAKQADLSNALKVITVRFIDNVISVL